MPAHGRPPGRGLPVPRALTRAALGAVACLATVASLLGVGALDAPEAAARAGTGRDALYLVTLEGPGMAGYRGPVPGIVHRFDLRREQDDVLARVGSPEPVYRWTTALSGVAVRLSPAEARSLAADPDVALVERNDVRRTASGAPRRATGTGPHGAQRGGAGTVVGFVDSGIWPENPVFADVPGLGRAPQHFRGDCQPGDGWDEGTCNRKVVGARWFVDGFGRDTVRSTASLSARDDDGHGSQMASIAAGNAGVSVRAQGQRLGSYAGVAPQARIAVYKACWTAPDPADDGCATADLVTAIDRATADHVDVLNLSVGGPSGFDTVERALLGAAEGDVAVVAAAGNHGAHGYAAHPGPWVTTVGGTTGVARRGEVRAGALTLTGAMASAREVGSTRLVEAADAAAPESSRAQARVCAPGSLDAGRVRGAVVLCERGEVGRVDKSAAVQAADGVGMVLVNDGAGGVHADFHSVPTVHLDAEAGRSLRHWLSEHPHGRVTLHPAGVSRPPARLTAWTTSGDPAGGVLKPDVVAPGAGILGAVPPAARATGWDFASGTSAATAWTSGAAALLRSRHDWSQDVVRSVLAGRARPLAGGPSMLRQGAGAVRVDGSGPLGPVLATRPGAYRSWLDGDLAPGRLNTASVLLAGDAAVAHRTISNAGRRPVTFRASATGFARHSVVVSPTAVRLAPGESRRITVRVGRTSLVQPLDDGWVTWRGSTGGVTRIPVVIGR